MGRVLRRTEALCVVGVTAFVALLAVDGRALAIQLPRCGDGLVCNGGDVCAGGTCTHGGDPCTGGTECNQTCDEAARDCKDPVGTRCGDDGNVCTDDVCDGQGACTHPNNAAPCDDGTF